MRSIKTIGSIALAVLVAFVIMGCGGETIGDYTKTKAYDTPSIGAVKGVKAIAYDGVIQVTWDPVADAKSYDVIRRNLSSTNGESKWLTSTAIAAGGNLEVKDIVDFTNQLIDKATYEYTVIANSGQSTSGRAIGDLIISEDLIWSTSATAKATAKIPAQGTAVKKPGNAKAAIFDSNLLPSAANARLQLVWDQEPGATYEIIYTYNGEDEIRAVTTNYISTTTNTGLFAPLGHYEMPYLKSGNTIEAVGNLKIRAKFANNYYLPSEYDEPAITAPASLFKPAYTATGNAFSATAQTGYYDSVGNYSAQIYTNITWTVLADAKADGYALWRAETTSGGTVIGSWVEVTAAVTDYYDSTTPKKRVKDTDVVAGKYYKYALVITGINDGIASAVSGTITFANHSSVGDPEAFRLLSVGALTTTSQYNTDGDIIGIEISWAAINSDDLDVVYTISRAQITAIDPTLNGANGTTPANIKTVGAWTELADVKNPENFKRGSNYTVFYEDNLSGMVPRQNYAYKVEAKKTFGAITVNAIERIQILNMAPYVAYSVLSIAQIPAAQPYYPQNAIVLSIYSGAYIRDVVGDANNHIEIWRRVADGSVDDSDDMVWENFGKLGTTVLSGIDVAEGNTNIVYGGFGTTYYEFIDTGTFVKDGDDLVDRNIGYEYKVILVSSGKQVPNFSTGNITSAALYPSGLRVTPANGTPFAGQVTFAPDASVATNRRIVFTATATYYVGLQLNFRVMVAGTEYPTAPALYNFTLERQTNADGKLTNVVSATYTLPAAATIPDGVATISYGEAFNTNPTLSNASTYTTYATLVP